MALDDLSYRPRQNAPFLRIADIECFQQPFGPDRQEEQVIECYRQCNDQGLDSFYAIDTGQNVDRVGGEGWE